MKKLTVLLLSILSLLSPLTVFAEGKDVTLWDTDTYKYQSELSENYTKVISSYIQGEEVCDEETGEYYDTSVTGYKCFDIHSEKEGYYAITCIDPDEAVGKFTISKSDDDTAEGIFRNDQYLLDEKNNYCGKLFKMKADESATAFAEEWGTGEYEVKFIFLGDEITSVVSAGPLVYNFAGDACLSEDYVDDECFEVTEMYPHLNVTFSENITLKVSGFSKCRDLSTTGTVKTNVNVLDESFSIDISYIDANELVKDYFLPEDFTPSCVISYDGIMSELAYPEYLSVVNDGNEETKLINNDRIILSNGRSYDCWFEYSPTSKEEGVATDLIDFSYNLGGIFSKTITFTPDTEPITEALKRVFENSNGYVKFGIKILKGKAGDWTKEEAYYFIVSPFNQLLNAAKYYGMFGEYLNASVFIIVLISPLIILAIIIAVIIILKKHHRKKTS